MPFPLDMQYIDEAEQELGTRFPASFRNRMAHENGGEVATDDDEWILFPFFDRTDKKRISRTCNHIVLETQKAREWQGFPVEAVAIASNGLGDMLVLLPAEGDNTIWAQQFICGAMKVVKPK
ncbi:SMI1/KNR4 family protein [uncultured Flavobacterium sp.]|uniref:SMI1/KNR4 family protein n=1 Tax=uncultured Flavobacterium sp. TaxID=165435 RepID=UPI0025FCED95|nr:SMI1/KNR4 family protein [uncultured Flavobacterium sp.]